MNNRDYEYVSAIAREGSFSKAAQKLYVSQPALSGAVRKIERELYGVPLFDRTVTPVVLTPAGEYYMEQAGKAEQIYKDMDQYFAALAGVRAGVINIGSSAYFCAYILPEILHGYHKLNPECTVNLTETDISGMDAGLRSGQFDLIIDVETLDPEMFENVALGCEYMLMAVPASFEINEELEACQISREQILDRSFLKKEIPAVDLRVAAAQPFLMLKKNQDSYRRCMDVCAHAGFEPRVVLYMDQLLTAYNVARNSQNGIIFFRDTILKYTEETDRLKYYKLSDPLARRNIGLSLKKFPGPTAAAEDFIKYVMLSGQDGSEKQLR